MTTTADPLAEAQGERDRIYQRLKEARTAASEATDPGERMRQTQRLKILRDMYREACDRVERLRPPEAKRRKAPKRAAVSTDCGVRWDFLERSGLVWSDLEGYTWNALGRLQEGADAHQGRLLSALLTRAWSTLTERQRQLLQACMAEGKSVSQTAEEAGVSKGTVSRVVRAGLRRLEAAVAASLVAMDCVDEAGTFDASRWAEVSGALTERQREYLYYLLTDGATMAMIAGQLQVNKSTVSRTNERIVERMAQAGPELPGRRPRRCARRADWRGRGEEEIAAELGISPGTYYRHICRHKPVGELSRFAYECLVRRQLPAEEAARELGCSPQTVRKYWARYAHVDVSALPAPAPYRPVRRKKEPLDLRRLLARAAEAEGTIGAAVSAETYSKMLRISGAERRTACAKP